MFFLDLLFAKFQKYRKMRGGVWYKFVRKNTITGADQWEWIRNSYITDTSDFEYHTKEDYE